MSATEIIDVGEPLPRIASVVPREGTSLEVIWADPKGQDVVDLAPVVFSFKLYRPLRDDPALFRSVRVVEFGSRLIWGDDDRIDMPADSVWELARQQMTATDFAGFLKRFGRTLDSAAAQLGISRRLAAYYAAGDRAVPRYIALACAQLDRLAEADATGSGPARAA